jgi:hypothetical protein
MGAGTKSDHRVSSALSSRGSATADRNFTTLSEQFLVFGDTSPRHRLQSGKKLLSQVDNPHRGPLNEAERLQRIEPRQVIRGDDRILRGGSTSGTRGFPRLSSGGSNTLFRHAFKPTLREYRIGSFSLVASDPS